MDRMDSGRFRKKAKQCTAVDRRSLGQTEKAMGTVQPSGLFVYVKRRRRNRSITETENISSRDCEHTRSAYNRRIYEEFVQTNFMNERRYDSGQDKDQESELHEISKKT